jgi:hypothetical protein
VSRSAPARSRPPFAKAKSPQVRRISRLRGRSSPPNRPSPARKSPTSRVFPRATVFTRLTSLLRGLPLSLSTGPAPDARPHVHFRFASIGPLSPASALGLCERRRAPRRCTPEARSPLPAARLLWPSAGATASAPVLGEGCSGSRQTLIASLTPALRPVDRTSDP